MWGPSLGCYHHVPFVANLGIPAAAHAVSTSRDCDVQCSAGLGTAVPEK